MRCRRARHNNRDRLPKGLRCKAFKDPEAAAAKYGAEEHAVDTPCDFVYADRRVPELLREWLAAQASEFYTIELQVVGGPVVRAIFQRAARDVGDVHVAVAVDALRPQTVYAGVPLA